MNRETVIKRIVTWLSDQILISGQKGFVIGISGGIDSALVSTLCAMTKEPTIVISLPIYQPKSHIDRASDHMDWLEDNFPNITRKTTELTKVFETFCETDIGINSELANANLRSRLRMCALYRIANYYGYLVAGTGNKVEDYGVAFFSKYGDGGVDISPIGDLTKTEVFELAKYLGVNETILKAKPTDGLWDDDRSDEDQIGATYPELEWAMKYMDTNGNLGNIDLTERQVEVLKIYNKRHEAGLHKMSMPPICKMKEFN